MKMTQVKLHGLKYIGLLTCYNDIYNMERIRKKEQIKRKDIPVRIIFCNSKIWRRNR